MRYFKPLREKLGQHNGFLGFLYRAVRRIYRWLLHLFDQLRFRYRNGRFNYAEDSNVVISLTTFPPRIHGVWLTIESLARQSVPIKRVVLVLCESEFPRREIPKRLESQLKRGLEIIWVENNIRSYKKLLPAYNKYSDSDIITVDDDVVYSRHLVSMLSNSSLKNPNCVVGARGNRIAVKKNEILPYKAWKNITGLTTGSDILLTGIGGIYYPRGILNSGILNDIELAMKIAPLADDIWFWAVTILSNKSIICLGFRKPRANHPSDDTFSLSEMNVHQNMNDKQFQEVLRHFDTLKITLGIN